MYKGYLTSFAYFQEWERQKVDVEQLNKCIGINLECGHLSYAEIPRNYQKKFGVTGTLETLHDEQKKLIKDYIENSSFAGSMLNAARLEIDQNEGFKIIMEKNQFF